MKIKVEFDTNDLEQKEESEIFLAANKLQMTIWDLDQYLRSKTKYATDDTSEDTYNAYQDARDELWRLINEHGTTNLFQ